MFYLFNFGIPFPLSGKAIIVGSIKFMTMASCENSSITRVEYFVDNVLVAALTEKPYIYEWNGKNGVHVIKTRAYNEFGGFGEDELRIMKMY